MSYDLVCRLRDEAMRLSGRSIDRGCADSGIAANLADSAADEIEQMAETIGKLGEERAEATTRANKAATAIEEARAEIERLRSFEKAKAQEETCDTFGEVGFVGIRDYAAMQARAEKSESELSTIRDMLVLCGELGGMGKDETPAAYLRRSIDEVAGVESLRARVREVVGPFARLDTSHTDDIDDSALVFENEGGNIVLGHLRAARQLMEEVK